MTAILEITDGTTTVSLLNGEFGYYVNHWRPLITVPKGGGTWQSSPLADGRRLVTSQWNNTFETFELKMSDVDQNSIIEKSQDLRRLLEKAKAYTLADWQNTPVYLKAQATCETYPRYARIRNWNTPDDENPFNQPFLQAGNAAVMDRWTLIVERDPFWTSNPPGTGTATAVSATESYDGRTLGRAATTANEVFVANKDNVANLTDVYGEDGGVFGPNLMDAVLPFDLFPAGPVVDDAINFGIDTTVANSGPFCSLVFDLSVVQNDLTVIWEYVTGCGPIAWSTLTVRDNTNGFANIGVNSVSWVQPSGWIECDVNGVTGFWVRARVSAIGAAPSPPEQQNRNIYSVTWPYVEINSAQVGGDVPTRARTRLYMQSDLGAGTPRLSASRFVLGLRSISRGTNFTAYWNASDEQNIAGLTVTEGANTAFGNDVRTPTGRKATVSFPNAQAMTTRLTFAIDSTLTTEYYGLYHVYLVGRQDSGAVSEVGVQLWVVLGAGTKLLTLKETAVKNFAVAGGASDFLIIDFGVLGLPGVQILNTSEIATELQVLVRMSYTGAATPDVDIYELILIPVDEWAGDFKDTSDLIDLEIDEMLDVDSVAYLKRGIRSVVKDATNETIVLGIYRDTTNGLHFLQANATQRLWMFIMKDIGGNIYTADFEILHSILVTRNQQYFSMRGNR